MIVSSLLAWGLSATRRGPSGQEVTSILIRNSGGGGWEREHNAAPLRPITQKSYSESYFKMSFLQISPSRLYLGMGGIHS